MSVREDIFRITRDLNQIFFCMLPMSVARSCSGSLKDQSQIWGKPPLAALDKSSIVTVFQLRPKIVQSKVVESLEPQNTGGNFVGTRG